MLFGKKVSGVLANCSTYDTAATLLYSSGQCVQTFLLKPAAFCKLYTTLCCTNKFATFLFSYSLKLSLFTCYAFSVLPLISHSRAHLAGTILSPPLHYQVQLFSEMLTPCNQRRFKRRVRAFESSEKDRLCLIDVTTVFIRLYDNSLIRRVPSSPRSGGISVGIHVCQQLCSSIQFVICRWCYYASPSTKFLLLKMVEKRHYQNSRRV